MSDNSSRASVGSVSADVIASSYEVSPAKQVMMGAKFPQFGNHINISKIKIYESNRRPKLGENGKTAPDFMCGDKTREDIEAIIPHAFELFSPGWGNHTIEEFGEFQLDQFSSLAQGVFATGEMNAVIKKMVYHMRDGNGVDYQNTTLTKKVSEHPNTKAFISSVKSVFKQYINLAKGDANQLAWEKSDLSKKLKTAFQNEVDRLKFSNDTWGGLRIALNDIWGYEIWLENYIYDGMMFGSELFFDIYDHFGLDDEDVKKITTSWGPFVPWFTLQRWKEYDKKYKPFVTRIPIKDKFFGAVNCWSYK